MFEKKMVSVRNIYIRTLLGFCIDNICVMLRRQSRVQHFRKMSRFYCALCKLSLDEVLKDTDQINFLNQQIVCIYTIYIYTHIYIHTRNNQNYSTSKELQMEIMKIGRAFALQWTAFSAGAAKIVRKLYKPVYLFILKL